MAISNDFTHFDERGNARMVNVGGKSDTKRVAVAAGRVLVNRVTFDPGSCPGRRYPAPQPLRRRRPDKPGQTD